MFHLDIVVTPSKKNDKMARNFYTRYGMKIAIVKLSAMGDIVHAAIVLQFIKRHYPDARIDWICEQAFAGVLEDNDDIDTIHTVSIKALKKHKRLSELLALIRMLRQLGPYDYIIDMQGLLKSAIVARLIGKPTYGFDKNSTRESLASFLYSKAFAIAYDANTIDRNIHVVASALHFSVSHDAALAKAPFLFFHEEPFVFERYLGAMNVVFIIGSTWESRNYPKELFAKVANALHVKYPDIRVLIAWGAQEEQTRGEWIAAHSECVTLLPALRLNALKALIAKCDLLIGNDTGPTHMAWAMNRPSITLFGPTPVSRVQETSINKVLKSPSVVDPYRLDKEDFSIEEITPESVVGLAETLLETQH